MITQNLLSLLIFSPLLGVVSIVSYRLFIDKNSVNIPWGLAIASSILTFIISLVLFLHFDSSLAGYQFLESYPLVQKLQINYHVGIDGLSLSLIMLTTFLVPICLVSALGAIKNRVAEFSVAFLLLESFVIAVFCSLDLVMFYAFFEVMLIPMFLIIGIWGGQNRVYAAYKFFLYTLAGSVFLLVAIIYIYVQQNNFNIITLSDSLPLMPLSIQKWLWIAFFVSFAVKIPMWPVHTWLPDAHVQAPTAGSVILAGILLKMGGYGFIRFSLPFFPEASVYFAPFVFVLSYVAVIYASLVALAQEDMKKLIAYSSIAHMGFVTIGIFSFNLQSLEGAMIQMVSHGLISGALFLCVGVLYERTHTREISSYGGVVDKMPRFALVMMLFTMASVGLPGTSGFVGEILVLSGTYKVDKLVCALASTGLVFGAAYMLLLYKRVMFGSIANPKINMLVDLTIREKLIFVPIVFFVLLIGIYPKPLTIILEIPSKHIVDLMERHLDFGK